MSSLEELQERIRDLEQRNSSLEQERENAKMEAATAKTEAATAKTEAATAKTEAEQARHLLRKTTLEEYLLACQEHVLSKIVLNTDGYLSTKAPTTRPTRKHCPRLLTPWPDFLATQQRINTAIARILPYDKRLFENITSLETIGNRVHARHVSSESSLAFIQNNCVEDPVRIIISELKGFPTEQYGITVGNGVYFETTATSLRDPSDGRETAKRDARLRTDQICVLRDSVEKKDIAYVIEYKAPHKLHKEHLDKGLRNMNILQEVVNKPTIPKFNPEKFQHYAELLSAAAVTQTYHYMVEAGLEYGLLTNGDAIVFLKIDWARPDVLLFHLARPADEVEADGDPAYSNAVCQVLAFTVLALQSRQHGNDERNRAAKQCMHWEVDFGHMVDMITDAEDKLHNEQSGSTTPRGKKHRRVPSSPEYKPSTVKKTKRGPSKDEPESGSDRVLRNRHGRDDRGDQDGPGPGGALGGSNQGSGSASRGGSKQGGSSHPSCDPSSRGPSSPTGGSGSHTRAPSSLSRGPTTDDPMTESERHRENMRRRLYCTPLCLLSLVKGRLLDKKCPNAALHCGNAGHNASTENAHAGTADGASLVRKHPVTYDRFLELLRGELSQSLERGVMVLGQEGACGAMFKITLLRYGYTFVAKGVTGRSVPRLLREEAVYQRLEPLQGRCIPVCLGSIDLRPLGQVFFYDFDVRIIYLLFLSHAGTAVGAAPDTALQARVVDRLLTVVDEMHSLGVVHGDVRLPNVLLNAAGQATLIDFDRASILPPPTARDTTTTPALSAIPLNKRRYLMDDEQSDGKGPAASALDVRSRVKMQLDRANARSVFSLRGGLLVLPWEQQESDDD